MPTPGGGLSPQEPCAPVLTGGPIVDAVWHRLLLRSGSRPGMVLTPEPDLHLRVDGERLEPSLRHGESYAFDLPATRSMVCVMSPAGSPAELGLARDPRVLGVALRRVALRQGRRIKGLDAADQSLTDGFYPFERDCGLRWTNGEATLPSLLFDGFDGRTELMLQVRHADRYSLLA